MKKRKVYLIKAGGEVLASPASRAKIIKDIVRINKSASVIFVHGGGTQIETALQKNGIPIKKVNGRRVTSPHAMTVVEQVLSGPINKSLAAELTAIKVPAVGLSCRDGGLITGNLIPKLGRAARPVKVKPLLLTLLNKNGFVPVVSTVASDKSGAAVNINADDAASALAVALRVDHLVFLTDISGVLGKNKNRIPVLPIKKIQSLIQDGTITGGMIPKVQSAKKAIEDGVGEVDIVNGYNGINLNQGTRIIK